MARRSKLNPELQEKIVLAVRTGAPLEVAAQSQGIGLSTFWAWMKRGELEDRGAYREFQEAVRKAEAEAHTVLVGTVRQAAVQRGNWQAAIAYMRMRWPKHYAERVEHTGAGGGPIAMEIASALEGLTEDELDSIGQFLAAAGPGRGGPGAGPSGEGST